MRFQTLDEWLAWQESLHPSSIDLGLERAGEVLQRLNFAPPGFKLISVAGTNGKGSSVAMLDAILRQAGYRTATYTSPHLIRYNERIHINGEAVSDEALRESFERIDQARGETSLTYFEFGTLAAYDLFQRAEIDVAIMEVGMGGRLDAVNLFDADVALVTAIDIDHAAWLGEDRERIAYEKAGIFRANHPAVCSDNNIPHSLHAHAREIGAPLHRLHDEFGFVERDDYWEWWSRKGRRNGLPYPHLRGDAQLDNASGVLMVLEQLSEELPVSQQAVRDGLASVELPGRFQIMPGEIPVILDVAHNPQAAQVLAQNLNQMPCSGRTHGVVAMLADKDMTACLSLLKRQIDYWYPATLDVHRGASATTLMHTMKQAGIEDEVMLFDTVHGAYQGALTQAKPGDRIVVFGSFYTVAAILGREV